MYGKPPPLGRLLLSLQIFSRDKLSRWVRALFLPGSEHVIASSSSSSSSDLLNCINFYLLLAARWCMRYANAAAAAAHGQLPKKSRIKSQKSVARSSSSSSNTNSIWDPCPGLVYVAGDFRCLWNGTKNVCECGLSSMRGKLQQPTAYPVGKCILKMQQNFKQATKAAPSMPDCKIPFVQL